MTAGPAREDATGTTRRVLRHLTTDLPPGDARWQTAFPVLAQLRPHPECRAFDAVHAAGAAQGLVFTGVFDAGERCPGSPAGG